MRRWMLVAAVAVLAAVPASGYGQTPAGGKMKDDKMKTESMEKKGDKMMDKKDDPMMKKDKTMDKKGDPMEKMDKMDKK